MVNNNNSNPTQVIVTNSNASGLGCGGCLVTIVIFAIIGFVFEWIEKNPTTSIVIGCVILALISYFIYNWRNKTHSSVTEDQGQDVDTDSYNISSKKALQDSSPWVVDFANMLYSELESINPDLKFNYKTNSISFIENSFNIITIEKRVKPKVRLVVKAKNEKKKEEIKRILDEYGIIFEYNSKKQFCFSGLNMAYLENNIFAFRKIFEVLF